MPAPFNDMHMHTQHDSVCNDNRLLKVLNVGDLYRVNCGASTDWQYVRNDFLLFGGLNNVFEFAKFIASHFLDSSSSRKTVEGKIKKSRQFADIMCTKLTVNNNLLYIGHVYHENHGFEAWNYVFYCGDILDTGGILILSLNTLCYITRQIKIEKRNVHVSQICLEDIEEIFSKL